MDHCVPTAILIYRYDRRPTMTKLTSAFVVGASLALALPALFCQPVHAAAPATVPVAPAMPAGTPGTIQTKSGPAMPLPEGAVLALSGDNKHMALLSERKAQKKYGVAL